MSSEGAWNEEERDRKREQEDLKLDNEILEAQVQELGGEMGVVKDIDPRLHNQFLRHILAFEEMDKGPKRTIRSLFPQDFEFPALDLMTKDELARKLDAIEDVLAPNNIFVELKPDLPDETVYQYVLDEVLDSDIALENPTGIGLHLDGCDGDCSACFQKGVCDIAQEAISEEEDGGSSA